MNANPAAQPGGANGGWSTAMPTVIAILATVLLPRLFLLHVSVIDWDESIFALIAQQWTHGHIPDELVFDHKPIGVYAIFAAFFLALGDTIWAIRVIPIVFVAATAALLARLAFLQFGGDRMLAALAAALYGLLTLTNGGLASNTEILVNLFVVLAICIIVAGGLDRSTSLVPGLLAGASLGVALQINYLSAILVMGVAGYYLAWMKPAGAENRPVRRYLVNGTYMFCGFLLASLVAHLPIIIFGDLPAYFSMRAGYLSGYAGVPGGVALRRTAEALAPYWPFYMLALLLALGAIPRKGSSRRWDTGESLADRRVVAWLVVGGFAVWAAFASRRFYGHFFLYSAPALVMLAAAFLRLAIPAGRLRNFCALWLALMAGTAVLHARDDLMRGYRAQVRVLAGAPADPVALTGEYMSERLRPGETIYVHDGQPILYFMTRTVPPTRFAFPETHLNAEVAGRLGFTPDDAVRAILERKPRFIITRPPVDGAKLPESDVRLHATLERDYAPASDREAGTPEHVYERKGIPRSPAP
jgi:4-amino-4-deoxy-L-arabinose transferase-like glycosyltransferase